MKWKADVRGEEEEKCMFLICVSHVHGFSEAKSNTHTLQGVADSRVKGLLQGHSLIRDFIHIQMNSLIHIMCPPPSLPLL